MNAEDMNQPVFGPFYRPLILSKALSFHTGSSESTRRRESPANRAFLTIAPNIRIAQITRFAPAAEPNCAAVAAVAPPGVPPGTPQASAPRSPPPDVPGPAGSEPGWAA